MFQETLASIKFLSQQTMFPQRAEKLMHNYLQNNIKLTKRNLKINLMQKLIRNRIGTNDVMICAEMLERQNVRKRHSRFVHYAMKEKLYDAEYDEKSMRKTFMWSKSDYYKCINKNSIVDVMFHRLMRSRVENEWNVGKARNKSKAEHLLNRWKAQSQKAIENIRNVKYSDEDINVEVCDKNEDVVAYGGVEVSDNMKEVLTCNPKMMLPSNIDMIEMEVEIEKGLMKARWSLMNEKMNKDDDDDEDDENNEVLDLENKILDYSKMRVTDLPTCPRLILPKPASIREESVMHNVKEKLLDKIQEYRNEKCNDKGYQQPNITKSEMEGLRELKQKINNKEIAVFKTDKCGKLSVDSIENYAKAVKVHTENDKEVTWKDVRKIEENNNKHLKEFNKIFSVGSQHHHEERIAQASTSSNCEPPPLYVLRKTHKKVVPGQEETGPPSRPVCGARVAPNGMFSHMLSDIINNYCDANGMDTECKSSEEMRSDFEEYNNNNDNDTKTKCAMLSMDVKALYPSLRVDTCKVAVIELIENSELQVMNIDFWECAKYIALFYSDEEIRKYKLRTVVPQHLLSAHR